MRAGDAERDEAARVLRDACAEGRIDVDELDGRLASVYAAESVDDLRRITGDLPVPRSSQPAVGAKLWWPGITGFHVERRLRARCGDAFDEALRAMVPRMALSGFHVAEEIAPRRLRFLTHDGLHVTVMFHPASDGGTDLSAFGEAPRRVRKAFATLRD